MDFETSLHNTLGSHLNKLSQVNKEIPREILLQVAAQLTVAETQAMYLNDLQEVKEELSYIRKILQKTMLNN